MLAISRILRATSLFALRTYSRRQEATEKEQMPVKVFISYAHKDEKFLNELKMHLKPLERQELIELLHDRNIRPGTRWEQKISQYLDAAQVILLLVSPDF